MSQPVSVNLRSASEAERLIDPICDLYDETFSASPFVWTDDESGHHRDMLRSLLTEPSFGIATAEVEKGRLSASPTATPSRLTPAGGRASSNHCPLS